MNSEEKIAAIIAAVNEHQAIYAAVKAPATPVAYNGTIATGMEKALSEKIAAIMLDKPPAN
ncbi:MAG TPA: hypothetical protein VFJ90_08860 [Candidatus Didemnitutus sp.]|nr:hypothetical protein [Candidatus Didemnitutus sp.]